MLSTCCHGCDAAMIRAKKELKDVIDSGDLVADEIVVDIVKDTRHHLDVRCGSPGPWISSCC